jgi:hypothetical protein
MTPHPHKEGEGQGVGASGSAGPWAASWQRYDKHIEILAEGSCDPIAWVDYDDVDHDEAEATARLIAAAPDMLHTLEHVAASMAAILKSDPRRAGPAALVEEWLNEIRATIARARGEAQ